jgi:hypothetical protein
MELTITNATAISTISADVTARDSEPKDEAENGVTTEPRKVSLFSKGGGCRTKFNKRSGYGA